MNDLYQLMLGMMAGGQEADTARATLMRMVSEQDGMDPATQALLSRALAPAAEEDRAMEPQWHSEDPRESRRHSALHRLRSRFEAMREELDELRERQDRLAAALGACPDCWGEDPECEVCGGTGTPGSFVPDLRLYRVLVSPACRAARAGREPRLVRVTDPSPTHANGGAR
jgi:hypothetical protein